MLSKKVVRLWCLLSLIPLFIVNIHAQARHADMREAALLVGDVVFSPTDALRRYDWRGAFIDNMVPVGTQGITSTCCFTFGPDENLYVSSVLEGRVLRFNGVTGAFIDEFIPVGSGGLKIPLLLLFHKGYLYVGDTAAGAIRRYDAHTGAYVDNFIPDNSQNLGQIFGDIQFFGFGPDKNFYITASFSKRILRYDGQTGAFMDEFVPASEDFGAGGLAFGSDGLMYVASWANGEVRRYDVPTGTFDLFLPPGSLSQSVGIAFGPDGNFYAANVGSSNITRFDGRTGQPLGVFVPSGVGGMTGPRVIAWKAKTTVCHHPHGKRGKSMTLRIGYLSAPDHLLHGDTLGPCACNRGDAISKPH
jgi:WD40 repeat protein